MAILVFGLGANSRVYKKMQGICEFPNYLLLPSIHDRLTEIEYLLIVGDGKKDMPKKLVDIVLGNESKEEKRDTCRQYNSASDFNRSRYGGA